MSAWVTDQMQHLELLGEGRSSKVVLVKDPINHSRFALKVFNDRQEFVREQLALSTLEHPHILRAVCYDENQILLELCANGELFDYVKNKQFMPESLARFYFVQLLSAVQYMHKNGFIHGDIKLENILLDEEFNIKIADFGFSEQKGNREQRTSVMGTDGYFAPEQIQRLDHYGQPCDIFQMGVALFCMVTGKPPYPNEASDKDPYYRLIIQRKYSLFWQAVHHHTGQTFSAEFRDLINGMLAHRPTSRISIEEIQDHAWVRHKDVMSPDEVKSYMSKLRETNLAK